MLTILEGDALEKLRGFPSESIQCCVTSPPYWGLRDYGIDGQIGLEETPEAYVAKMVEVFREVGRVLRDDGTLWMNLGDTYTAGHSDWSRWKEGQTFKEISKFKLDTGLAPKNLVGIPWRVAFALQADGWYLRSDIIWSKPNPMPESVTDRPTKAHEYIFLFSKNERYFYDAEAIRELSADPEDDLRRWHQARERESGKYLNVNKAEIRCQEIFGGSIPDSISGFRNKRSVWTVPTAPYPEAHFATYPPDLIKPCILAGTKAGDVVLDPFAGSGTTGMVVIELGRKAILIELNPDYIPLIETRCNITVGFAF